MSAASTASATASRGELIKPSHGNGYLQPAWRKGQSGNPTGTQGEYFEVRKLCADRSVEATKVLFELLHDDDSRVRFLAVKEIHDRGIGKPRDHSNEQGGRLDLTTLSDDERKAMADLLIKAFGL